MAGALCDIRVIDFGQYVAGPLTTMLLGDQGAEVIRIDPPGGPRWRSNADAVLNRGKRRITLDLKNAVDFDVARRLCASADVVVENFRPGVMERLGLGASHLLGANRGLIYCSLPGFAADDPRATIPAWEGVVGAATATYRARDPKAEPHFTAIPLPSNFAAFTAANSIVAALLARQSTGSGQRIETPLFDAMFEAFGVWGQKNLSGRGQAGMPANLGAPDPLRGGHYQCADGRWIQLLLLRPRHFDWFADRILPTQWRDEGLLDRERLERDPVLVAELGHRVAELFKTRTAWDWERAVNAIGTPLCVCRTTAEWLQDAHAIATRSVVAVEDPQLGPMMQAGFPVALSESRPDDPQPRRALDADRDAIMAELGTGRGSLPQTAGTALTAALEGVRVIDTTQIWAGPTAGRVLAEYGADVVKINDTSGDILSHLHVNSGKRSLLLDLRSEAGLKVLWKLVERSDVFMQNFARGTADRLGIGYAQVRAHRPDIIYSSVSAYGHDGPRGADRGWEPVGQAATGMQERMGGAVPMMQPWALCDYGTGLMGAFSVLLGLFHRARTGNGQRVEAALSMTGTLHQTPFMFSHAGRVWDEPRGPGAKGSGPLQRLYRAADGWLFLGAKANDLPKLAAVPGFEGIERVSGDALEQQLAARFQRDSADASVARLIAAGVGAHRLVDLEEIMEDAWVKTHRLSVVREHEGAGLVRMVGPSPRLSATPVRVASPARPPGADGPAVLSEIGLGEQMEALVQDGVVVLP